MSMTTNKQTLREAAEKATPGKWWIDSHGNAMVAFVDDTDVQTIFVTDSDQMGAAIRHEDTGNLSHWRNDNDATFIAAANPATVLALLDELEAAERRNAELHGVIMSSRKFINEYAAMGDAGAAEFIGLIDRAAATDKGG
nr:ead/Ea22-like family protein [Citrobacter braakii]